VDQEALPTSARRGIEERNGKGWEEDSRERVFLAPLGAETRRALQAAGRKHIIIPTFNPVRSAPVRTSLASEGSRWRCEGGCFGILSLKEVAVVHQKDYNSFRRR